MQNNINKSQKDNNPVSNNIATKNQIVESNDLDNQSYCANNDNSDDDDEGEAVDMDAFVESGLLEDDSVIVLEFCI